MDELKSQTDSDATSASIGCLMLSEEGDLLVARLRGEFGVVEERAFQQWCERLTARHGYRLVLAILDGGVSVTPEARRLIVEWNRSQTRPASTALVGATFAMRTVVNLLLRAVRLLTSSRTVLAWFASEAEARVWLAEERKRYLSTSP